MAIPSPLLQLPSVQNDLSRVEQYLLESVRSKNAFMTEVASHLILAGGKRGRPAFTIAAAGTMHPTLSPVSDDVIAGAVAVELVHLGSLYHDDVMDDAITRRTVASVNARWGNLKAILAGDFLLARASEIASSLGTEIAGLLANTISRLCEGQVLELQHTFDANRSEEIYLESIQGKTAALFATASRIGGIVVGADRPSIEALTIFGNNFGMAFQIIDDILDIISTDEELGKPSAHDLVEGVYTLPTLRVLADSSGEQLKNILGTPLDDAAREQAREIIRQSGHIESSLETAQTYITEAQTALDSMPSTEGTQSLITASDHLLHSVKQLLHTHE